MSTIKSIAAFSSDSPKAVAIKSVVTGLFKCLWLPALFVTGNAFGAGAALTEATTVFKDSMLLIIGIISAIAFLIVAWSVLSKFNDARRGRGEWGEVILPFIVGAAILVLMAWLVEQATTAANAIGA